jgi:hypothetical protein
MMSNYVSVVYVSSDPGTYMVRIRFTFQNRVWHCVFSVAFVWCTVLCYCASVLYECLLCIDNEQSEVPECAARDFPEQQPDEGKCPLTYYVLLTL